MARPAITSRSAFIEAALEFIDRHGVDGLSLRTLGKQMDISHAAIYRHFANKDDLLNALIDQQIGEAIEDAELDVPPKTRLWNLAQQLRRHFDQHPNLLRPWINGTGAGANGFRSTSITLQALTEMGISVNRLPHWLRVLENFVIGSMVYDYSAAPNHLEIRSKRLSAMSEIGALEHKFSAQDVAVQNQQAFDSALEILLNHAESEGHVGNGK